jgi:signal transduction histidine kinase/ActR/RegA family two-component response regulator
MCAVFALALLPFTLVCVVTGDIDPRRAIAFHAAAQLAAWACCISARTQWGRRHASVLLFVLVSVVNAGLLLAGVQTLSGGNPLRTFALLSPLLMACLAPWRPSLSLLLAVEMAVIYLASLQIAPDPASGGAAASLGVAALSGVAGALTCQTHRTVWASLHLAQAKADDACRTALAADRAKSEFLANMSHEIRTPLTAILGFTDELIDEALRTRRAAGPDPALLTVKRNGQHLLAVVNDILDLSRIEAGKFSVASVACSPVQIVADVVALLQPRALEKQLRLETRFRGPIPEQIQSDPTRLHQILVNLVGNAIKFTEHGGITLRLELLPATSASGPLLAIDVVDTGIGLSEADQVRIFEAFAQADATLARRHGGSGLGLTISRALARLLGGDLTVSSAQGRGSVFRASIATGSLEGVGMLDAPQAIASPEPLPAVAYAREPEPLRARVLLAEDGADNQVLISLVLRRAGLEVEIACDGQIACEMVVAASERGEPFDLIVMDMQMPLMTGYEAAAALRRDGFATPILALTAQAMAGDRERCLAAGCDEYLSKPIDRERLVSLARALLEKRAV